MSGRKNFGVLRGELDARLRDDPAGRARFEAAHCARRNALALAKAREDRAITQQEVARILGVSQANVSRIEREGDIYLSTLRKYVEALGGRLQIAAVFPEKTAALALPGEG
ncbi:MAG TPA: XRE family transcriptional regulator [Chloroflexota bacterium]|nr:XRE family transcriptional regulator [Chloroflexota bacterium]